MQQWWSLDQIQKKHCISFEAVAILRKYHNVRPIAIPSDNVLSPTSEASLPVIGKDYQ